jgi:putative sigma-54 modulation protein
MESALGGAEDEGEEEGPSIVRVQRFAIKPMSEEEAMLQIEMIGHSFYVFLNADTNQMNVLYKRKDGNYASSSRKTENRSPT